MSRWAARFASSSSTRTSSWRTSRPGLLVHRGWDDDDDVAMFRVRDAIGQHVHPGPPARSRNERRARARARPRDGCGGSRSRSRRVGSKRATSRSSAASHPSRRHHRLRHPEEGGRPSRARADALSPRRGARRSIAARSSCAMPETGRLHQVRRHLRHIHHPLVGDVKHGSGTINRHYRATYGLTRLALHAHRIAFDASDHRRARERRRDRAGRSRASRCVRSASRGTNRHEPSQQREPPLRALPDARELVRVRISSRRSRRARGSLLVIHRAEARKPTNTGKLAAMCFVNSEIVVRGHEDRPTPPFAADPSTQPVLLFPHDDAVPLEGFARSETTDHADRPRRHVAPSVEGPRARPGSSRRPVRAPSARASRRSTGCARRRTSTASRRSRRSRARWGSWKARACAPRSSTSSARWSIARCGRAAIWRAPSVTGGVPDGAMRHDPSSGVLARRSVTS